METRFESVTVDTEGQLRTLFVALNKKSTIRTVVILLALMAAFTLFLVYLGGLGRWAGSPLTMDALRPYIIVVILYIVLIINAVLRPGRAAKKVYLRTLEYYDNSMPAATHRFYDDYFVTSDVDSTHISPYRKLRKVEIKGDIVLLIRKDGQVLHMNTAGFTKGTLADFCQFIQMKTNMPIIQK
jgi:hypothetical protein